MLQLEPSFDIQALEALVTVKLIQNVVAEALAEVASKRGGTGKEPTLKKATVPRVAINKKATVEKDATLEVAVGEKPTMGGATPKVTPELALDDASREAKAAKATLEDEAD